MLADLQPEGELLCALADHIVELHWRLRQALGLEQHALREQQQQNAALEGTTPPSARPGFRGLSEACRLLDTVADQAEHRAATPSDLIDLSRKVLGDVFTLALFDFKTPNLTAMWMAEGMCAKKKTWFQKEKPSEMIEKTPLAEGRSASEIDAQAAQTMEELRISHSSLCYEMQRKLVAVKREQLAQMAQQVEAEARWEELTERKDRLERYGQYQAGLARQLERAEVHYFKLRALLQSQSRS